jgi:hypothetical protein
MWPYNWVTRIRQRLCGGTLTGCRPTPPATLTFSITFPCAIGTTDDLDAVEEENTLEFIGAPSETRTPDPLIKSQLLYQLS